MLSNSRTRTLLAVCLATSCNAGSTISSSNSENVMNDKESEKCACLEEKRDLWLCGFAEKPTPPYEINNRETINSHMVDGAIIGMCSGNPDGKVTLKLQEEY